MHNYDYYDGNQLKQAFEAAHAGMETMFRENPHFDQAHLDSARAFITDHPLFAQFTNVTPVTAETIQTHIQTYLDIRPDQEMDDASAALVHRWVSAYAEEIKKISGEFDDLREETQHVVLARNYPATFRPAATPN